jgi:hypothetical protein
MSLYYNSDGTTLSASSSLSNSIVFSGSTSVSGAATPDQLNVGLVFRNSIFNSDIILSGGSNDTYSAEVRKELFSSFELRAGYYENNGNTYGGELGFNVTNKIKAVYQYKAKHDTIPAVKHLGLQYHF